MNANAIQLLEISILLAGPIPDIKSMGGIFLGHIFRKKSVFCLLAPPKQMSFVTSYNRNIFLMLMVLDWVR